MSDIEFVNQSGVASAVHDEILDIGRQSQPWLRKLLAAGSIALLAGAGVIGYDVRGQQADQQLAVQKKQNRQRLSRQMNRLDGLADRAIKSAGDSGELRGQSDVYADELRQSLQMKVFNTKTGKFGSNVVYTYFYQGRIQRRVLNTTSDWQTIARNPIDLARSEDNYSADDKLQTGQSLGYITGGIETGLSIKTVQLGDDYRFVPSPNVRGHNLAASGQVQAEIKQVDHGFYYYAVGQAPAGQPVIVGEQTH